MKTLAIIGAGISGLIIAEKLAPHFDVHIFDKARGVSGRMATRRSGEPEVSFDHGAQYFTVRSNEVKDMLGSWITDGVVAPWDGRVAVLKPGQAIEEEATPRFVAVPAMNALVKHLAKDFSIQTNTPITKAQKAEDGWYLTTNDGVLYGPFDMLICSAPPEQSLAILGETNPFAEVLAAQSFDPCWATMVHFEQPIPTTYDGAFVHENPLRWICRNNSKPGRQAEAECWVLHATPEWSKEHLELPREEITPKLLEAMSNAIGQPLSNVIHATSHRWRYSAPATPLEQGHLWSDDALLGICGDWCSGARVEGAIQSGLGLSAEIIQTMAK